MRLLLVACRYPWPPRRGDQLRALQWVEALGPHHRVTLLAPAPAPGEPSVPDGVPCRVELYRRALRGRARGVLGSLGRGLPLQSGLFYHPELKRRLGTLAPQHDLAILLTVRLAPHRADLGEVPFLIDFIDALSLNFRTRARCDRLWLRPLLRGEAARLELWEQRLVAAAAAALVVCDRDRKALIAGISGRIAGRLQVVPVAVETADQPVEGRPEAKPTLALTGNLGYFVNHDAARWWLAQVWPRLCRLRPGVELIVAGARPRRSLVRLARRSGARLVASPPDLEAVLAQATVAVAPTRCGSGVPLKVLEAWRLGVPVVASSWAAAGTSAVAGEDLLVADEPQEWIDAVGGLLDDARARRRLGEAGRRRLEGDYSKSRVRQAMLQAVEAVRG